MRVFRTLYAISLLLPCATQSGFAQRSPIPSPPSKKLIQRVIEITNRERVKQGLAPLKRHDVLCEAATWMAKDMAENRYFAHQDKQGRTLGLRLQDFGYARLKSVGENIAAGQEEPKEVVAEWLKSPGHRANLFGSTYREIGVGYVASPKGEYESYWVQDFGMRSRIYPVVINEEHAETDTPKVHLYIYGEGWAEKMRVSNDKEHWSAWEPYKAEKEWELEPGEGKRVVYVELQPDGGDPQISEDAIDLVAKEGANTPPKTVSPNPVAPKPVKPMDTGDKEPKKQDPPPAEPPKREEPKKEPPKKEEPPPADPPKKDAPKKEEPPKKDPPKKDPGKEPVPDC